MGEQLRAEPRNSVGVNRIDHFAIQVSDLWQSFEFYRDFLGAQIHQIAGADTERLWHRQNQILFINIAGHKGVGLAVSDVDFPRATRIFEHNTIGFEVTEEQLKQMQMLLSRRGINFNGPKNYKGGFPILSSLWFQDPDGHTIELCVRSQEYSAIPPSASENGPIKPQRISHMRIEVTEVDRSSNWYQNTLGFDYIDKYEGEVYLKIQDGDQLMVLRPIHELSPRRFFVHGPHIDFQAPKEQYPTILERIENREGYWNLAPHPFVDGFSVDHSITVYFFDPDGNRFQISPGGNH